MKYKLGDEVYLKGVITSINSCAEIKYLYEVKTADEFVTAAERHLEPINKEEAPLCLRNVLARLRGLPEHDREAWLNSIMGKFERDLSHAKWREGYEQGKFEGMLEREKLKIPQFIADKIEYCKKIDGYRLFNAMDYCYSFKKCAEWLESNEKNFALAWIFGYEVEKEKRYIVKVKGVHFTNYLISGNRKDIWFFHSAYEPEYQRIAHTRKELEDAGFGWVFDCEGVEVQEVE